MTSSEPPKQGILFPEITRKDADDSLLKCFKYMCNFAFYKFGIEICFMATVAVIGTRLDIFAVIYAICLLIMFNLRRTTLARIWPFYVTFLAVVLCIEYALCIGIPPGLCIDYPWNGFEMNYELRQWLFLPDYFLKLAAYKLSVDFFQLLFASCQLFVFVIESSPDADSYEGGSNKQLLYDDIPAENPIPDFLTYTTSYLDLLKLVIFSAFFWVTLAIVFLAGTNRVSILALGYVIGCFMFLWNGQEFFLKPLKRILQLWNLLLTYNVMVIFLKSCLQLVGCVFIDDLVQANLCWLIQLFGIACLKKFERGSFFGQGHRYSESLECRVPDDEAGLLWDGICIGFLVMQRRIFSSYYFFHQVREMEAQTMLASRGAELINELLLHKVQEQDKVEHEIVEKIKKKMDRIRANQQKIRGKDYTEATDHWGGTPSDSEKRRKHEATIQEKEEEAIRSGDYYMFEEYSDDDELDIIPSKSSSEDETSQGLTVGKFFSSAIRAGDIKQAVEEVHKVKLAASEPTPGGHRLMRTQSARYRRSLSGGRAHFPRRLIRSRSVDSPIGYRSDRPVGALSFPAIESQGFDSQPGTSGARSDGDTVKKKAEDSGARALRPKHGSPPVAELDSSLKRSGTPETEEKKEPLGARIATLFSFMLAFLESLAVSATNNLNAISRDYRYVAERLRFEKQILKETNVFSGPTVEAPKITIGDATRKTFGIARGFGGATPHLGASTTQLDIPINSGHPLGPPESPSSAKEFQKRQMVIVRLLVACWYAIVSRSEIVCYITIVVNQIGSASLLSLPLPVMVFLWGTLSIPRPSKTFWVTIITYTEAIVVIKYLFQFDFFPWNRDAAPPHPFWPPRIIGVEKKNDYAVDDLVLLLIVFFHRFMLKSLGLWKDTNIYESAEAISLQQSLGSGAEKLASGSDHLSGTEGSTFSGSSPVSFEHRFKLTFLTTLKEYLYPIKIFGQNLLHPTYRVSIDVYAFMFVCDFITFIILVFGYSSFGTGGGAGVASYLEENRIPIPFLVMLIAQFGLIIIDRALFLRKFILGKIIFQICMVFIVHLWMFFVLPVVTDRNFNQTLPPRLWYFVKCIYLLLSAYQIRAGYPTRILGNFLTKKYNYMNLILFRGFMAVPFLFELRALMDWIWTDTSMSLSSWLKMEDIFSNIFILKCQRRAEAAYPTPRGTNRSFLIKYGIGGLFLFGIIAIIWFPLVLFALGNTVGVTIPPTDFTLEISLSGYQPIFKMSAQNNMLQQFREEDFNYVSTKLFKQSDREAVYFFQNYGYEDLVMAKLNGNSTAVWGISPPSQSKLIEDLLSNNSMTLKLAWFITRAPSKTNAIPLVSGEYDRPLTDGDRTMRNALSGMLNGTQPNATVTITSILPKFLKIPANGKSVRVKELSDNLYEPQPIMSNLTIALQSGRFKNVSAVTEWWEVKEDCKSIYQNPSSASRDCSFINVLTFNDKAFPTTLTMLSGGGIISMYTTLVLLASRFVRGLFAGVSYHIMFDDMPYVDRILQLCLDIYLVRESGELHLEEDLFSKLIFLYRSPETLIKWTRFPSR